MNDTESLIRERAYHLWEPEGRPHGRDAEHWEKARRDIETAEQAPGGRGSRGTAAPAASRPRKAGAATERRGGPKPASRRSGATGEAGATR